MNDFLLKLQDECHVIEYKEKDCEGLYKTVSAFSNTDGGCIILGVNDKKKLVGVDLSEGQQEAIVNKIADSLGIQPVVKLYENDNLKFLKIVVKKFQNPIQYKGIYYKRVGSTNRQIPENELRLLLLDSVSWDGLKTNCSLNDINEDYVTEFVKMACTKGRLAGYIQDCNIKSIFEHLGLVVDGHLTNAAILLFGKNPQKYFCNSKVRVTLFKGNNESVVLGDKIIDGNLFDQINNAETAIKSYINLKYKIKGKTERTDIWDYPLVALREALLNAIIHKNYHDFSSEIQIKIYNENIWFYNSGELFGGLTIEQLKSAHPSKARNPIIMQILYLSGLVEQLGSGVSRMIESCSVQGIPLPDFKEECGGFSVRFFKEHKFLNARQKNAIKYILENEFITNSIYQEINDCSRDISKRELSKLCKANILNLEGETKTARYVFKLITENI